MEIAWIGTGIMGAPMARRLLRAGHRVRVHNRSAEKARALSADGAAVVADPVECARGAEAVFIMVSDTPDVEGVVAKRADSPYRPGVRSGDWLKLKTAEWKSAHAPMRHRR